MTTETHTPHVTDTHPTVFEPYKKVGQGNGCNKPCCVRRGKSHALSFRSTWEVKEAISRISDGTGKSKNDVLEELVIEALNKRVTPIPVQMRLGLLEDINEVSSTTVY